MHSSRSSWQSAERHFENADRIAVLTTNMSVTARSCGSEDSPSVPEHVARYLKEDFPAIEKIARAVVVNDEAMIATGDRALRSFGVAVDPEFLELFELPFMAGDPRTALRDPRSVVLTRPRRAYSAPTTRWARTFTARAWSTRRSRA